MAASAGSSTTLAAFTQGVSSLVSTAAAVASTVVGGAPSATAAAALQLQQQQAAQQQLKVEVAPPLISCVAIVGRQNTPLYIKTFSGEEMSRMQFAVFSCLDMIAEKVDEKRIGSKVAAGGGGAGAGGAGASGAAAGAAAGASSTDPFLGLLYPVEEHKIFGYLTNTNIKILVVVRDVLLREDKVRELFKALHRLYIDAVSNPFVDVEAPITSPLFEQAVYRLVEHSNAVIEYRGPMPF